MTQHTCGLGRDGDTRSSRVALTNAVDRLLDTREVSELIGRAESTLEKDRLVGTGIPFVRIGRLVRYRQTDVIGYLAALPTRHSTSEAA